MSRDNPLTRALGIGAPQEIEIDLIDIAQMSDGSYGPSPRIEDDLVEIVEPTDESDAAYASAKIKTMINHAQNAVADLASLAKQSDSPRAYEVLATVIKTVVDAAKDVAAIEEKKLKSTPKSDDREAPTTVNNNLFVGTTADLAKIIRGIRENKEAE